MHSCMVCARCDTHFKIDSCPNCGCEKLGLCSDDDLQCTACGQILKVTHCPNCDARMQVERCRKLL